ncbi:MAG: Crp/Fnr family transcriptional regulator [Bacteroidales bacterium]
MNRTQLHFNKGEIICKQGAYASNILFIYQGSAKNYLEAPSGKNNIISVIPEGEMIGLPSLFSGRIYPYSASALEECLICSIDINLFEELVQTNGTFAGAVIKCLNNNTIQSYDRYIFNKQRPLKGRLAEILLHLSEDIYRSREFKLTISRNDLAEWTQMAPESVTRIFTNFKKEKLIGISGKSINIIDIEGLRRLSVLE